MRIKAADDATAKLAAFLKRLGGKLQSGFVPPRPAAVTADLPEGGIVEIFHDSGLLVSEGIPVFAYIRDHTVRHPSMGDGLNKVHFAVCDKLKQMQRENRFKSRYRKTTETTGFFKIDVAKRDGSHEEKLERLYPCQYCLGRLGYEGFNSELPREERNAIVRDFNFEEVYDMLSKIYQNHLAGNKNGWPFAELDQSGAPEGYPDNWPVVAYNFRKHKGFKCRCCGVVGKHITDVHHRDGDKSNLNLANLQCLCKLCHVARHPHYAAILNVRTIAEVRRLRKKQGIPEDHICDNNGE